MPVLPELPVAGDAGNTAHQGGVASPAAPR
jgi:hypothetical protein